MLDGKVAVITGGGRGIGRAVAIGYAKAGASIICAARTEAQIASVAQEIRDAGGQADHILCDIDDAASVEALCTFAGERFGGIDIFFANAGVNAEHAPVAESDPAKWEAILRTNLIGAYNSARAAIPYLRRSAAGKLIFTGSGGGHRGFPNISAYACAKAGVRMLVRVLAQELVADGICVHELVPGVVDTDMYREGLDTAAHEHLMKLEWVKQPEDVVPLALFIATQPAFGPSAQTYSLTRREL